MTATAFVITARPGGDREMSEVRLTEAEWRLKEGKAKPKRKTRVAGALTSLVWFVFCVVILVATSFNAIKEGLDAIDPVSLVARHDIQIAPFILCFIAAAFTVVKGGIGLRGIGLLIAIVMIVSVFLVSQSSRMAIW